MEQQTNKPKKKRKLWYRCLKQIMKIRYKKPTFMFLGADFGYGSIILSNHEGTDAPMSLEIYCNSPTRMWGAHEMNSGLISMYKYQTRVYYHEKKGWNLGLARLFCIIASPLTHLFYKGLNLISTYKDGRFIKTIRESIDTLKRGENVVIYPEDSTNGYLAELEGFHGGFVSLADIAYKRGLDIPIYVTYYRKSDKMYIIDKPVLYSQLIQDGATREEIADKLRLRCNELGKMQFSEEEIAQARQRFDAKKKNNTQTIDTSITPETLDDEEELGVQEP